VANKVLVLGQPAAANEEDDFIGALGRQMKKWLTKKEGKQKWLCHVAVANVNSKT